MESYRITSLRINHIICAQSKIWSESIEPWPFSKMLEVNSVFPFLNRQADDSAIHAPEDFRWLLDDLHRKAK